MAKWCRTTTMLTVLATLPSIALGAQVRLFPGVASTSGANNTVWRSEVYLHNEAPQVLTAQLEIIPRDSSNVSGSRVYSLGPSQGLRIPDVYAALSAPSGAGTLRVTGDVLTWVRTFNQGKQGTFGQNVPPASASRHDPNEGVLFAIHTPASQQSEFRSNLLIMSLSDDVQRVETSVGSRQRSFELEAGTYTQISNVGAWIGASSGDGILRVVSDGAWCGYVSAVDPITGDPTTVEGALYDAWWLNDQFDAFGGWSYMPDSSGGASFRSSSGLLAVSSFGSGDTGGPSIAKALKVAVDAGMSDYSLEVMAYSKAPGGNLSVQLLDADGAEVVGFSVDSAAGYLDLTAGGVARRGYLGTNEVAGKVALRQSAGLISLHYKDGPAIVSTPQPASRPLHSLKIRIVKTSLLFTPDTKVDWVRIGRL